MGEYYTYNPQSHTLTIGGARITIPGNYTGAYPIPFDNGYIIVAWGNIVSAFKWVGGSLTPLANLTGIGNWAYIEADGVVTGGTAVIAFLNTYNMRLYVSIIPLNGESCTPGLKGAVTTTVAPVTTTTTVTTTVIVGNTTTVTRTATVYVNTTVTVPVNKTVTATVVHYLTVTATARVSGSSVPLVMVIVIVAIVAAVTFLVTRRHYAWL